MFLKILLGLDALVIAVLGINFIGSGAQIRDSYLLLVFAALMLLSYSLRIKQPKLAVMIAALPVLSPIVLYAFLAFIFIAAPIFN